MLDILLNETVMIEWLKNKARLVFSSSSVQLKEDLHSIMKSVASDLKCEVRRNQLIDHLLHDSTKGITTFRYTDHDIIVSLTSYGRRVHEVFLSIESIMQQTMKPNRIVLWLDESYKDKPLPQSLLIQKSRGLEIAFCPDIKSYTKLIPQMRQTPDDAIITIDDDILYDHDVLEHLIQAYIGEPGTIHCCRVHKIGIGTGGDVLPYKEWEARCTKTGKDGFYFITGVGGALYPPGSLDEEVFNEDVFMSICPDADDIWFTAMALKKGTPINKVFTRDERGEDYISNPVSGGHLSYKNVYLGGNDCQLQAVFSKYSLFSKLQE